MEAYKNEEAVIAIGGLQAEIIETRGRLLFSFVLNEEAIPRYRRKILQSGCCQSFLPMRFLYEHGNLRAYYDFGCFLQLKNIYPIWKKTGKNIVCETLATIIAVVRAILAAENYLFHCDDFCLHPDTIFIHPVSGEVRLAYVPGIQLGTCNRFSIGALVLATEELAGDEQWKAYAYEISERILSSNQDMAAVEKLLNDKGREIYSRQWPEKSSLREQNQHESQHESGIRSLEKKRFTFGKGNRSG